MNATWTLQNAIAALPEGEPFFPAQFLGLASRASIDQSLSRLVKAGKISRLTRGVYVRPKKSQYVGEVMPEPRAIAEGVAASQGAVIQVHGAEAARRMELTTQMPMQPIYYTTGHSRNIVVGKLRIRLQHASPKTLAMAGRPAGLALTALKYLGKRNVTPEVIEHVRRKLPAQEFEALRTASTVMPAWLSDALNREARLHG